MKKLPITLPRLHCATCERALEPVPHPEYGQTIDALKYTSVSGEWFCSPACRVAASAKRAEEKTWPYCSVCGQQVMLAPPVRSTNARGRVTYDGSTDELQPYFVCGHAGEAQVLGIDPALVSDDPRAV